MVCLAAAWRPFRTVLLSVAQNQTPPPIVVERPTGLYVSVVKPLLDRVVGLVAFILLLPVTIAVAIAVRVSLGSPILFKQKRVGLDGREFEVLKFRTMGPDRRSGRDRRGDGRSSSDRRQTHKTERDPRHTDVGRFLRKWSLDELPQLWNIVRGDMSLVGPRPELVGVVKRYEPWQHQRHLVKPGLTGLWQVSARGTGLMHLHTDVDLEYVRTIGPITDLKILLKTIPAVIRQSGS
jgi:lipopolysaccharide/colanic/teichoic acid biosynthesis glycosyltransferase